MEKPVRIEYLYSSGEYGVSSRYIVTASGENYWSEWWHYCRISSGL